MSVRHKVCYDLTKEEISVVNSLIKSTGATSKSEVIRRAIRLYNLIIEEHKNGNKLFLHDLDNITKEILIF